MIRRFISIYKDFDITYEEVLSEIYFVLDIEFNFKKQDTITGKKLSEKDIKKAENIFKTRVLTGKPIQYITQKTFFMDDIFTVNENVLIPRDDTEILVNRAIALIKDNNLKTALDIGTGSGIIAIEVKKRTPASVFACDISEKALKIAKENAKILETEINFFRSDLFKNVSQKFDILISNPPYIPLKMAKSLQKEVTFEPSDALFGSTTGLYFYEKITENAKNFLNPHGFIAFEFGINQSKEIVKMLEKDFTNITVEKDVSGTERVVSAQLKS